MNRKKFSEKKKLFLLEILKNEGICRSHCIIDGSGAKCPLNNECGSKGGIISRLSKEQKKNYAIKILSEWKIADHEVFDFII